MYPAVAACLALVTVVGVAGVRFWPGGGEKGTSDALLGEATRRSFSLDVTEKGEFESSGSAEVRCEVKSAGTSGAAIIKLVPEGTVVKAGDMLAQLDSSRLESEKTQQQIAVNASQALVIQAQAAYETAVIARQEYLEGTFTQERQTLASENFVAEENLRRAQQYLLYSRRLAASGYIPQLQLDADSFSVENARNALSSAQTKLRVLEQFTKAKMLKQLDSDIASTEATWEANKKSYELEQAKLAEIEDQIGKCLMVAPAEGQVKYANKTDSRGNVDFLIEEGAILRENQVAFRLPDPTRMRVKVNVNEALLKSLAEGMAASIRSVTIEDKVLRGHVEKINQYSEPSSWRKGDIKEFAVFVKIDNPDSRLLPGMSAEVTIHCQEISDALQVPVQAVFAHGVDSYCIVRTPTGWESRKVQAGANNETFVVIKDGLAENEQVSLRPKSYLKEVELPELSAADMQQIVRRGRQPTDGDSAGESRVANSESGAPANAAAKSAPSSADIAAKMLARFDSDGDGLVSATEWPAAMQDRFAETDANGDGQIDGSEIAAGMARMRAAGGGRPGAAQ